VALIIVVALFLARLLPDTAITAGEPDTTDPTERATSPPTAT
jgi:hypothetical protein